MLLIFTQKPTARITYVFKHLITRVLGVEIQFTSTLEEWLGHAGPKISYGKQPMGNELFFQSVDLLSQQGIESVDISVKKWEETYGFFPVSARSALPFDIFAASFYLLSRYEEYLPHVKDDKGRFVASESIAGKNNFLMQPVVDIWAYKLKQLLLENFPELAFPKKSMTVHSVVEASQPFAYSQKGIFRNILGYVSDAIKLRGRDIMERTKVIIGMRRDPYDRFKWMVSASSRNKAKVTVFFMLGESINFVDGVSSNRKKYKMLVKYVGDYKEIGLLFSFDALADFEKLKQQKKHIEEITNRTLSSTMNAQLLVDLPDIYRNLVELEVQRDFTMTYANTSGFRAGTCTPFLFYDLDYEIKTPLTIHPIATTTYAFKNTSEVKTMHTVNALYDAVASVNGTFTVLFSNRDFSEENHTKYWRTLFSEKLHAHEK